MVYKRVRRQEHHNGLCGHDTMRRLCASFSVAGVADHDVAAGRLLNPALMPYYSNCSLTLWRVLSDLISVSS